MPEYQVGDKVMLTEECGSSVGWIFHTSGGPGPTPTYELHADWYAPRLEGATTAGSNQIAELLPGPPVYVVGQSVTVAGRSGTITDIWPDGRYLVEVAVELSRLRGRRSFFGRTATWRNHLVPAWRLALEGN